MGARGPAPKPVELRILEGNPGKRAINHDRPKPKAKAPIMPDWLPDEGKAEWKRIAPELLDLGLLTVVDGAALAAYCEAWATFVKCSKVIAQMGESLELQTKEGATYLQVRPEVSIREKARLAVKAFCQEFGLTPSSRGRMTIPQRPEADPTDGLLD